MSATLSEFLTVLLIFIGTFISFLSAVGLLRFPDVYSRAHALSKSSTIGVVLVLVGTLIFFVFQEGFFSIRLLLAIFFVFLTTPVSAHVIIRSAYRTRVRMTKTTVKDDLAEYFNREKNIEGIETQDAR